MGQLFSNLLSNAVTHGSSDKPIVVKAATQDGTLELSVANSGDPIPPTTMERPFHPFYRGDTVRQSLQGLGLGLYIASEIARAHGGTREVNSSSDETSSLFECQPPEFRPSIRSKVSLSGISGLQKRRSVTLIHFLSH